MRMRTLTTLTCLALGAMAALAAPAGAADEGKGHFGLYLRKPGAMLPLVGQEGRFLHLQRLLRENRLEEAATMAAAIDTRGFGPWAEMLCAQMDGLLTYAAPVGVEGGDGMAAAERGLAKRLAADDLAWTEREALRALLCQALLLQGKTAEYVQLCRARGFATLLKVIGPLSNRNREGFAYPDTIANSLPRLDYTAAAEGRGRKVYWHDQPVPADGILYFNAVFYPSEEIMAYAAVNVTAAQAGAGALALANGGAVKVWVNGELLGEDPLYVTSGIHSLQRLIPVHWRQGPNQVLVKVAGDAHSAPFLALRALALPPQELTQAGSAAKADAAGKGLVLAVDAESCAAYQKTLPDEDAAPAASAGEKQGDGPAAAANDEKKGDEFALPFGCDWGAMREFAAQMGDDSPAPAAALALLFRAYGLDDADFSRGAPLAEKALAMAPESTVLNLLAATRQKNDNRRRQYLRLAAEGKPASEFARCQLMQMDLSGGFERRAAETAQAMLKENRNLPPALHVLAQVARKRDWEAEEHACALRLTQIVPYFVPGWERLAATAANAPAAIAALSGARPYNFNLRLELAGKLRAMGKVDAAEKIYREILLLEPDDPALWQGLADCRVAAGDLPGAVKAIKDGLNWMPQSPKLLERSGRLLLLCGHDAEGEQALRQSLERNHDNPDLQAYCESLAKGGEKFYAAADLDAAKLPGRDATPADYPDYPSITLLDQAFVRVNPNGTTRLMVHTVCKVLRPAGVRAARAQVYYDPERQRVDVVTARVTQPDGSVVETPQVVDFPVGPRGEAASTYSSGQVKEIRLPQARPGSIVEIRYVREDFAEPLYFNQFSDSYFFGGMEPALTFRYTVSCPEGLPLHWQATPGTPEPKVTTANGVKTVQWDATDVPGVRPEPAMPPIEEIKPAIAVSTFADWAAVSAWADALFKRQMGMPEDMRAFTHELVKGCPDREAKIKKVYQFVTDEIRYVSISFGVFGYQPHRVERTFRSRYGDCKDTAVLLVAMLRELGIEAWPALVRTRDKGEPSIPLASPSLFNHCIAYVPADPGVAGSRAWWLDGTTDYHSFGVVPYMDKGTNALLVKPASGGLQRVDSPAPADNRKARKVRVEVQKGGAGKVTVQETVTGDAAAAARELYNQPKQLERMLRSFAQARFPGSTLGEVKTSAAQDLDSPLAEMTFSIESPRLAVRENDGMRLPVALVPRDLAPLSALAKREYDLMLGHLREEEEEVEIILPEGAKLERLPEDINLELPAMTYSRTVQWEAPRVTIKEKFLIRAERVTPGQYAEFRDACGIISMAASERLFYGE